MPNSAYAFGIDLSKYNTSQDGKKRVDFNIIAAHQPRVAFIGIRAGISWGYQDPWFNYYFSEGMRIKRVLMPYHVLYPGENADRQMDNFFRILGDINFSKSPLVLDLELDHGQTVSKITQTTRFAINIIYSRTGRMPIIYSRALWVNQFLKVTDLPLVYWWLAQYRFSLPFPLYTPEYPCPPAFPRAVHAWSFHQTTQRGRSIGAPALYYMDYNRFNGTEKDLRNFAGQPAQVPVICPLDGLACTGDKIEDPEEVTLRTTISLGSLPQQPPAIMGGAVSRSGGQADPPPSLPRPRSAGSAGSSGKPPLGATLPAYIIHKQKQCPINKGKT